MATTISVCCTDSGYTMSQVARLLELDPMIYNNTMFMVYAV
jgi:hypothetical protein